MAFVDVDQGVVARFLPDGTYDASFRSPKRTDEVWETTRITEVSPDGSILLIEGGRYLRILYPDGSPRLLLDRVSNDLNDARSLGGGEFLVQFRSCLPFNGCSDPVWMKLDSGSSLTFLGTGVGMPDVEHPTFWSFRENRFAGLAVNTQLLRTSLTHDVLEAGWSRSGIISSAGNLQIFAQRSGATASKAIVRGRVLPRVGNDWDESRAVPLEIEFPVGQSEVVLSPQWLPPDGEKSLGEYLLRMDSASGVSLSSFTDCRLWVVSETAIPAVGELGLISLSGAEEQHAALLCIHPAPDKWSSLVARPVLNALPVTWSELLTDFSGLIEIGPARVMSVATGESATGYFRLRTQ